MVRQSWRMAGVAALAAAALFFAAGPSLAAGHGGGGGGHGGGGHGGGGHASGGVAHSGGFSHGGYNHGGYNHGGYNHGGYNHGYHHDRDRFFFGFGLGFGYPFYGGYYPWYYPGYYGGGYYGGYGNGDYAAAAYAPSSYAYADAPSTYTAPSVVTTAGTPPLPDENAIYIRVQVPPDAEVWFEGQKTTQAGPVRFFESPPVAPGRNYVYHIRARWSENGRQVDQTRDAPVYAGDKFSIDFTKMRKTQQREKVPAPREKGPE